MDPIRFSIHNPVKVAVGVILVILFGLIALTTIPIQLTPDVERPVITVRTEWPGRSPEEIESVRDAVARILDPLGHRVYAIVNYDNFSIQPELVGRYTDMVKALVSRYYTGVTRYTTSTFLRMKIGEALKERKLAPHIYESREEAEMALRGGGSSDGD